MLRIASKTQRPWMRNWTLGLIVPIGLALCLLWLCRRSERKDGSAEAQAAYDREEWSRASDLARNRLKSNAHDLAALRLLARSSIRMGRDGVGVSIYRERLSATALEPEDAFLLGLAFSRQGDPQRALSIWSKAAQESPEHPELLLSLANLMARNQRLEESTKLAQRLSLLPGWQAPRQNLTVDAGVQRRLRGLGIKLEPALECLRCPDLVVHGKAVGAQEQQPGSLPAGKQGQSLGQFSGFFKSLISGHQVRKR